jgi:predicted anti-sigma-YlaC factor YlaD
VTSQHTVSCAELHALVSCKLDGAVSQFELALASAHLRDCADCAAFEAEVGAFTKLLREARPERPRHTVALPYGLRFRRHARVARGALATAAVAMAAVTIGGSVRLADGQQIGRAAVAPANDAVRMAGPAVPAAARLVTLQELYRDALAEGLLPVLSPVEDDSLGAVKPVLRAGNV